jgi:hypothetical protein
VTRIPKIVALLAFLLAAGCRDSFPQQVPPLNAFYYPVGIAVRSLPATGRSVLVVVSSNFDLRYDPANGGTVLSVDPDLSGDASVPGSLAVLGAQRVGSFGGEVAIADASCVPLAEQDPAVAAGGAKVVFSSRSRQVLYRFDMTEAGVLSAPEGYATQLGVQLLDPYGVGIQCSTRAGLSQAYSFHSHLAANSAIGLLSRMDLVTGVADTLVLGSPPTYGTAWNPLDGKLFISSVYSLGAPVRWIEPEILPQSGYGTYAPLVDGRVLTSFLAGGLTRDLALSSDGKRLYVNFQLVNADAAAQTGIIIPQGGGIGVLDLTPNPVNQPTMQLLSLIPTCLGVGQLKVLPTRGAGVRDLLAVTCDTQGLLMIYDDEAGKVVTTIGLDPSTGLPQLGLLPFGLAAESIAPSRATQADPSNPKYRASPCGPQSASCTRLYVASFQDAIVSILEFDPARPDNVALVKQIGGPP